ncbi:MAG: rhodanese-like domain-containing protein [Kofleriaceae bacterium]
MQTHAQHGHRHQDISPSAAYEARETAHVIDVREPSEFTGELGHIPGAQLVPVGTLEGQLGRWDKDAAIIVICRSGSRSTSAAQTLTRAGFRRVMNMAGGMIAYNAAKLPVATT